MSEPVDAYDPRYVGRRPLRPASYADYLETLVLSLLAERKRPDDDIVVTDPEAGPSMRGTTCSPILIREEIALQRWTRAQQ